uniref:Uncharacterized protein LOC104226263 n=1 Tax=Nicotiana sylvestris TaxID=4096 RepID=A0A1U7WCZ1_NICSY|nr:PREDICTED: uncharacterized protein LOC104226263 [Nicotiana sylvestris]
MDMKNETILIETNFGKSKVTTRRLIKWDEIDFPREWVIEEVVAPRNTGNTEVTEIEQTSDGTVKIRFNEPEQTDNISLSSRLTRSNSSYISPIDYVVDFPSRASTSQIRENNRINEVRISSDNIVKIDNNSDLEPTQSFHIGEKDKIIYCTAFSKIFENDVATITAKNLNTMLTQNNYTNMYVSILGEQVIKIHEKLDKLIADVQKSQQRDTKDRAIAEMIIAGFTGQLKGWWDNYLTHDQRFQIMNATKTEDDKTVQNSVYSLVMNIIEHFSGRWSDNSETIRTMLQNLRCKTLTSFRWYKDVFLSRVMELPKSNSTHWKSKFIDGLPPLFAERIRKVLRGTGMSIDYNSYSYGKLFSVCTQKGLALCNEIKLNQQIKKHRLTERQQLGEFCEQFAIDIPSKRKKSHKKDFKKRKGSPEKRRDKTLRRKAFHKDRKGYVKSKNPQACYKCGRVGHYAKDCKIKDKIKELDLDDTIKDSLYKILLNSSPEISDTDEDDSSTSDDLRVFHEESYTSSSED